MDRRRMLCGMAGAGLIAAALAACSDDDDTAKKSDPPKATEQVNGKTVLATKSDITVGGGVVVTAPDGTPVVVVQPSAGQYKAFDARCTHQQTVVNPPNDNLIVCPQHQSEFSAVDGSVKKSPATRPLTEVPINVDGENIVLA